MDLNPTGSVRQNFAVPCDKLSNHIRRVQFAFHADRQALTAELVDDVQRSIGSIVIRSMVNEVVGPDVIDVLRSQTNTRPVIEPQPTSLRLLHGNLQPLTAPQAFDPLIVQLPSCISQHGGNPPITVTPVLPSQLDHVPNKKIFIVTGLRHIALRGSMLL